jgi:2Fe-2S ferredoxin
MPMIKFVAPGGETHEVQAQEGYSLMEVALANGVPGIVAECGGACTCATCHVYIAAGWLDALVPPDEMEEAMLEFADGEVQPNSRLACQIKLNQALDGMVVELPR